MKPWLQLLRLPAVFTAMADIFAGFILTHGSFTPLNTFLALLGASCSLYLAGMVLNDFFDHRLDLIERPERPIPSGRIAPRHALLVGVGLLLTGIGFAFAAGLPSVIIAVAIALSVLAYDSCLKGTLLGPWTMGLCRGLNLLLGASAAESLAEVFQMPQLAVAGGLALYIVGVTTFASDEAKGSRKLPLILGMAGVVAGIAVLCGLFAVWTTEVRGNGPTALFVMALIGVSIIRRMVITLWTPSPAAIQSTVKLMLLSYVILCGVVVHWFAGNIAYSLATVALIFPAMFLGRVIRLT